MYEFLIWCTGGTALAAGLFAYIRTRDVFHPLIFIAPMLAFSYFLQPLFLVREGAMWRYLPAGEMPFVQGYYLCGVLVFCVGALFAQNPSGVLAEAREPSYSMRRQLRRAGIVLGSIGVVAFLYMVSNVGGFEVAYGREHGHGWASSGYVREAFYLIVPGLLMVMLANLGRPFRNLDRLAVVGISAPLVVHGILSAARGPTFMILITLFVGWYVIRHKRPGVALTTLGLAGVGVLLLVLVTHRSVLHLGGQFEFRGMNQAVEFVGRASPGNEYIFGSGIVIDAKWTGEYQWGARYVIQTIVRAIPRSWWPTQYEDSAEFFGIESIRTDVVGDLRDTLGWQNTGGASMGLLADVWKQLWWFGLVLLFLVGRMYAVVWRRSLTRGGIWVMAYVILLALSIFLTQQTFQAMLFRLMFLAGFGLITWKLFVRDTWVQLRPDQTKRSRRRTEQIAQIARE